MQKNIYLNYLQAKKPINGLFPCKIALYIYTHKNVYTHI